MNVTMDREKFGAAVLDTAIVPMCLKKRSGDLSADPQGHGVLVFPYVGRHVTRAARSQAEADEALYRAMFEQVLSDRAKVTVRGHGWNLPGEDNFVWTGTLAEFKQVWGVD